MSKESPESPPHWSDRHLWQIQPVRDVLAAGVFVGLLILGQRLSLVTVPLLLALLLAYLCRPLVERLVRTLRIGPGLAAGGILAGGGLFIVVPVLLALAFGILQAIDFASAVAGHAGAVAESVAAPADEQLRAALGDGTWREVRDFIVEHRDTDDASGWLQALGIDRPVLRRAAESTLDWLRVHSEEIAAQALGTGRGALIAALATLGSIAELVFGAFLTALFFFFTSTRWPGVVAAVESLVPVARRERVLGIVGQMDTAVSGFVRGRLMIGILLGVFYTIGFALLGVPAPLIVGPVLSLITLIPFAALAAVPVVIVLLGLQDLTGFRGELWWVILAPFALYQIAQALDDYVLTPLIQGKSTGLDTPTILFASMAGGILLGVFGLLVAIPLAACTRILLKELVWPRLRPGPG